MSGNFRTPPEELQHLLSQIAEVKATLREIAGRVSQIERHLRRAFQVPKVSSGGARRTRPPHVPLPPPTLTASEALKVFDELVPLLEREGRDAVVGRISGFDTPDLRLIVQELGVPLPKKRSRSALTAAILGRVNESRLLSRNRNVTAPRSTRGDAPDSPKEKNGE